MELRVLRYFLEVAREGNITHAAQRLHISQPTLSKQLKELEVELGKKLFIRGNYNVRLTDEGMLLRKRAEDILDMVGKTEEEFKALGEITGGDVRIGCAESDGMKFLAQRVKAIQDQYPSIRFHLYSGDTDDLSERLDRGLFDFAVIAQKVDLSKYNYLEFPGADTWGVVMRKDAPLAEKEKICIDDLLDLPLIVSRQGLREDIPKLFGEKIDRLNVKATINLTFNGSILIILNFRIIRIIPKKRISRSFRESPCSTRTFQQKLRDNISYLRPANFRIISLSLVFQIGSGTVSGMRYWPSSGRRQ